MDSLLPPAANDNTAVLRSQFLAAQQQFFKDMSSIQGSAQAAPEFLRHIPNYAPERFSRRENCYNFALDLVRHANDCSGPLQPGYLSDSFGSAHSETSLQEKTIARAERDGLKRLSSFLDCSADEIPLALFFDLDVMLKDYHWFALRRLPAQDTLAYAWAHKRGEYRVQLAAPLRTTKENLGHINIFNSAAQAGYRYFAGFFAAPKAMTGRAYKLSSII